MSVAKGKIHIGTSGWHYKHWKGTYYPADTHDDQQFGLYQKDFNTVELNNSFYHLPEIQTFKNWKNATPAKFIFSVKGSRFITHMKKLNIDKAGMRKFFTRVSKLGDKLGPILFQLPPKWKVNTERLEYFLKNLPKENRYTFELRDHTWYTEEVYELLKRFNCAFCIYELEHHISPVITTADFVYIRLHGPGNKYQGSYSTESLKDWAGRLKGWQKKGMDSYIYFDNDQEGYAAFNAKELLRLVK